MRKTASDKYGNKEQDQLQSLFRMMSPDIAKDFPLTDCCPRQKKNVILFLIIMVIMILTIITITITNHQSSSSSSSPPSSSAKFKGTKKNNHQVFQVQATHLPGISRWVSPPWLWSPQKGHGGHFDGWNQALQPFAFMEEKRKFEISSTSL